MDTTVVTQVLRDGVWVVIKIGGPMLVLSMVVGVLIAIFQAVTQIHEQTLGFIMKMSVIILTLLVAGCWMGETVLDYAKEVFSLMAATR